MRLRTKLAAAAMTLIMVPVGAPDARAAYTPVPSACYAEMAAVGASGTIVRLGVDGGKAVQPFALPTTMTLKYSSTATRGFVPKALTLVSASQTSTEWRYRYYSLSTSGVLRYHVFVVNRSSGYTRQTVKTLKTGWTYITDLVATEHRHLYTLSSTGKLTRWSLNADATLGSGTYLKTITGIKSLNYAGTVITTIGGVTTAKRDLMMAITSTGAIKAYHLRYWGSGSDRAYTVRYSGYSVYETIAIGACSGKAGVMMLHDVHNGDARVLYDTFIINGISAGELSDRGSLGVAWRFRSYGS